MIVLILMLIGAFPGWPNNKNLDHGSNRGFWRVVIVIVVRLLMNPS